MARFGAYANVMPVLGNEIELKATNYQDSAFDLSCHRWVNETGAYLKSRVAFGQPVSVHNPCWQEHAVNPSYFTLLKDWPFAGWTDFILKQIQVGSLGTATAISDSVPQPKTPTLNARSYARRNQLMIDLRRYRQPLIDEEPGYDYAGTESSWNAQTPETMRKTFWTGAMAGGLSVWGSTEVYVTGDPLPKMKESTTPPFLRIHHDVMAELPFHEMRPYNACVTPGEVVIEAEPWRTNFVFSKPGEVYLVYSLNGGNGSVSLLPGRYTATRIDPRTGDRMMLSAVAGGSVDFALPSGDWVLLYQKTER
jgi:hypothetical protein